MPLTRDQKFEIQQQTPLVIDFGYNHKITTAVDQTNFAFEIENSFPVTRHKSQPAGQNRVETCFNAEKIDARESKVRKLLQVARSLS